jgi:hypothetical protein
MQLPYKSVTDGTIGAVKRLPLLLDGKSYQQKTATLISCKTGDTGTFCGMSSIKILRGYYN